MIYYIDKVNFIQNNVAAEQTRIRDTLSQNYVTPLMYGAVGDGVNDDSDAVQNAVNSGLMVYFPSDYTYRITKTITVNTNGQIISGAGSRSYDDNCIIFDSNDNILLDIRATAVVVSYLTFQAKTRNKGTCIRCGQLINNKYTPDNDCKIIGNTFRLFNIAGQFYGRGVFINSNIFTDCTKFLLFDWGDDTNDNDFSGYPSGYRALRVENNRFHSGQSLNSRAVEIKNKTSGYVNGLLISGNFCDGQTGILLCDSNIKNSLISGNVVVFTTNIAIVLNKKVENVNIINNVISASQSSDYPSPPLAIQFLNGCDSVIIANNQFRDYINAQGIMYLGSGAANGGVATNVLVDGNIFKNVTIANADSYANRSIFAGLFRAVECSIINNYIDSSYNASGIVAVGDASSSNKATWKNCIMINNHIYGKQLINTASSNNINKTGDYQ
jgi:hypothetical protein